VTSIWSFGRRLPDVGLSAAEHRVNDRACTLGADGPALAVRLERLFDSGVFVQRERRRLFVDLLDQVAARRKVVEFGREVLPTRTSLRVFRIFHLPAVHNSQVANCDRN